LVFADQAADDLLAFDPGGDINGMAGLALRFLLQTLVRTVPILVPGVLSQHLSQVLAEDQHVVEALAPQCPRTAPRRTSPVGDRTGVLITRVPLPEKTASTRIHAYSTVAPTVLP
jgi:hypothetical protein